MSKRYEELDSLRGIAAFIVLIHHSLMVLPILGDYGGESFAIKLLKYTPLHLFWAGHEAVLLFFLLSGFVLSLPFYNSKSFSYASYIVKRICRLYIPFAVAITIAIFANYYFSQGLLMGVSEWFNKQWTSPITLDLILKHYLVLGEFDMNAFDPPIWSLVHEMRISIIFPLIMLIVLKIDWKLITLAGLVTSFVSLKLSQSSNVPMIDYFITAHYASVFMVGALLAKHRMFFIQKFKSLPLNLKRLIGIVTLFMLAIEYLPGMHNKFINEWVTVAGAVIVMISAMSTDSIKTILNLKPMAFLGKISFSMYLYHMIIIFVLMHVFYGKIHISVIWLLAFVLTMIISTVAYYIVELPSMNLGRKLSKKISSKKAKYPKEKAA